MNRATGYVIIHACTQLVEGARNKLSTIYITDSM